jgi:LuxR family transcriptional regulator, maltose regulon positive regulatory protein
MALISRDQPLRHFDPLVVDQPLVDDQPLIDDQPARVVIENTRRVPPLPAGAVPRPRLLTRLARSQRTPLVLVVAPAGWGKTTLLTQWAHVERRPVAWLTIEARHNDPDVLRSDLNRLFSGLDETDAADRSGAADTSSAVVYLHASGESAGSTPMPAFAHRPDTVLVLDDVHLLHDTDALDLLALMANHVAAGSQVVLSGRVAPWLRLGRRRVNRQLHEIGHSELAMTVSEAGALLAAANVLVPDVEIAELVALTEGWAAGLYLAALAHRERRDPRRPITALRGSDRAVAAFFREEVLVDTDENQRRFLTRTCMLDSLSGPLCDAVLDESGSGRHLEAIVESGNLFLVPLDRDQDQYRYHRLFAELLLLELRSREPEMEVELHERAARWFEVEGHIEQAAYHARCAQALDRAGDLLLRNVLEVAGTEQQRVLGRALDTFAPREVSTNAALSLATAWHQLGSGNARLVEHWLDHAETALRAHPPADGGQLHDALRLTRAWVGLERGNDAFGFDAFTDRNATGSQWWPLACLVEGLAHLLAGRTDAAELLRRAERSSASMPVVHVLSMAYLALLSSDDGDWAEADRLADRIQREVETAGLGDYPPVVGASAMFAVVRAFHGDREGAANHLEQCRRLLGGLGDLDPTAATLTWLMMSRAQHFSGDRVAARATLVRTEHLLARLPLSRQAGLRQRLARHRAEIDAATPHGIDGRSLTPAERRVLEYLPTHLTMAEIAQRLYVSRNTVKSQAIAIYQKLGASSRGKAVDRAKQLGLLPI